MMFAVFGALSTNKRVKCVMRVFCDFEP